MRHKVRVWPEHIDHRPIRLHTVQPVRVGPAMLEHSHLADHRDVRRAWLDHTAGPVLGRARHARMGPPPVRPVLGRVMRHARIKTHTQPIGPQPHGRTTALQICVHYLDVRGDITLPVTHVGRLVMDIGRPVVLVGARHAQRA